MSNNKDLATPLKDLVTNDGKKLNIMLNTLEKTTKNLNTMKTVAAASCVMHAIKHGNVTPMNVFLSAVGEGERNDAIVRWAVEFGPFKWKKDKETNTNRFHFDLEKSKLLEAKGADYAQALVDTPYWVYVPQKEVGEFDLDKAIIALVKRAEHIKTEGKRKANLTNLDALKAFALKVAPAKTVAA